MVEKELLQFMLQKEDQQRRKLMASNNTLANQGKKSGELNIGQRDMLMQARNDLMDGYQMQSMLNFPEYGRANVNIPRADVLNMHQAPMNAFMNQQPSTSMYPFLGSLNSGLPPSIQQNTLQSSILQGHVGIPSVTGLIPNNMTGTKQLHQEELKSLFSNETGLNSQLDPFSVPTREEGVPAQSNKRKIAASQPSPIVPVGDATALLSSSNMPSSHDARVEKKKIREKKRRSELTDKFQMLSSLLWEIEEAGLMKEGNTTTTNEEPVEGSEEPDQKKQKQSVVDAAVPGNRIDVIGRAVEILRSFRDMNQSLKTEIAELKKQIK